MRLVLPLAALALAAQTAQAQSAPTSLTLDEAVALARRNNPLYLQTVNARRSADFEVKQTYAAFLPSVGASMAGRLQKTGQQFVQGVALSNTSDVLQSSYSIGLNYSISSDILFAPKISRANQAAAEADVTGAAELMRSLVVGNYLLTLRSQAFAALQDTLVLTTKGLLELAKARQAVGNATILDVRTAEVALGRAEIAALTAHNTAEVQLLRLFEQIGVPQPEKVALTTRFNVAPVTFRLDSLLDLARRTNPALLATQSRERAASTTLRGAQGRYLPTLNLSTGWGGNSSAFADEDAWIASRSAGFDAAREGCFSEDSIRAAAGMARTNCNLIQFTPAVESALRAQNSKFPFDFTKAPRSYSIFIQMPIFDNLQREGQLQRAAVARTNAQYRTRAAELQLVSNVTEALRNLQTAFQTVGLNDINAAAAREQLSFAEERYRVGAATFLDVTTSRGTFEQAQIDRLNSIYDYHRAYAALENAVGRPLR